MPCGMISLLLSLNCTILLLKLAQRIYKGALRVKFALLLKENYDESTYEYRQWCHLAQTWQEEQSINVLTNIE